MKPSYSFPWSLRLGTLVFTVNPSFVLVLNCFQGKENSLLVRFMVNSQSAAPTLTLMFLRRLRECKDIVSSVLAAGVQDAYAHPLSQPKSLSPSWQLVSRTPTPHPISALVPRLPRWAPRGQKRTPKAHSFLRWQLSLLRAPFWSFLLFILIGRNFDTKQNRPEQHTTTQNSTMHF